jgi:hypothetical protein
MIMIWICERPGSPSIPGLSSHGDSANLGVTAHVTRYHARGGSYSNASAVSLASSLALSSALMLLIIAMYLP